MDIEKIMDEIDNAIFNICQKIDMDKYGKEVDSLTECKKKIKKVLNDHFDQCARNRNK